MIKLYFTTIFFLYSSMAYSIGENEILSSPKANFMGGAFTAISDDEYTLFYNPASLGRNDGFKFAPLNLKFTVNNVLNDLDKFKNLPDNVEGLVDRIGEIPLSINFQTTPSFKIGSFAFNYINSLRTNMIIKNKEDPILDVDYKIDRGFTTGIAFGFGRGKINTNGLSGIQKKRLSGYRVAFGLGLKYLDRTSIDASESLFSTGLFNLITSGNLDFEELVNYFGKARGKGIGFDLGSEVTISRGRTNYVIGLAILDVGDTSFKSETPGKSIKSQKMSINSGLAIKQDLGIMDFTFSTDIKPLNQEMEFGKRLHFGAELNFQFLSIYGGIAQGYLSYGLETHLWPFKISLGKRTREFGNTYKVRKVDEIIAHVSLFNFSFNL